MIIVPWPWVSPMLSHASPFPPFSPDAHVASSCMPFASARGSHVEEMGGGRKKSKSKKRGLRIPDPRMLRGAIIRGT